MHQLRQREAAATLCLPFLEKTTGKERQRLLPVSLAHGGEKLLWFPVPWW